MASLCLFLLLLHDYPLLSIAQSGPVPIQVATSDNVYGPDGPWQAVSVQFGTPGQELDLYPGGLYQSWILTSQPCQNGTASPCGSRFFDPELSSSLDKTSIVWDSGSNNSYYEVEFHDARPILDDLQIAGHLIPSFDAMMYPKITMAYPDGNYSLQLGTLAIGPVVNQTFSGLNGSLIPGELFDQKLIPSSFVGLHVGIAAKAFKLSLSLWLGGYDSSRIVGPVSFQTVTDDPSSVFVIDLLDIGIGVDHGGSPFAFSSQGGLLNSGNLSMKRLSLPVIMDPGSP